MTLAKNLQGVQHILSFNDVLGFVIDQCEVGPHGRDE